MHIIKIQNLALLLFGAMLIANHPAWAGSDLEAIEKYQRARAERMYPGENHAGHGEEDSSKGFHGVYYGFVPCKTCLGTKMTLSLNQNNNYLLVIQSASEGSRESYEKGKYVWNEESRTVVLTPRKGKEMAIRYYHIQDEETLAQANDDGTKMTGDDADLFVLRRSDTVKTREIHFH
ncbi:MAG: copper resistance protein NlpE [Methylococcales bacterium]|nr:copper resistance protein NlpE [Methylococcales bacterium]